MRYNISIGEWYYVVVVVLIFVGFSFIYDSIFSGKIIRQKFSLRASYNNAINIFSDKKGEEIFENIGINHFSIKKYVAYRNLIALIMLLLILMKIINGVSSGGSIRGLILIAVFMLITEPKQEYVKGHKTPFKLFFDFIYRKRQDVMEKELTAVISQMRNLIITNNNDISSDYIFKRIIPYTNISKPVITQVYVFLMKGRKEDAAAYFEKTYSSKLGKSFAQVLLKLDALPPVELLSQIEIMQEVINDEKETNLERKRQRNISIIFFFAAVQLAVILFDFIYIILTDSAVMLSNL